MNNLSRSYAVPATSNELEKQAALTPDTVMRGITNARRSALIEQLTCCISKNGGTANA